jgi:glycerol uptake facilitator-like aquaporin
VVSGWLPSTWGSCEKVVLSRARRLAKASLDSLLSYMAQDTHPHWKTALLPPLAPLLPAFDVLIRYFTLVLTCLGAGECRMCLIRVCGVLR